MRRRVELAALREENQRQQAEIDRLRRRARRARGSGAAAREDLRYLFVVTYGRSGSTLLMGLLNAIPGYLVRGENKDAVHHLFGYHAAIREAQGPDPSAKGFRQRTHPFFGLGDVPHHRVHEDARRLVLDTLLRPREDTRVTGFKEIRWYHDDLPEYVAWLREVFPGARFVVNTRRHDDVLRSAWWAKGDPAAQAAELARIERGILDLADGLGEQAHRVHYDDYVTDPTALRGLYDWLGEDYDEDAVRATLAVRHSVRPTDPR